MVKLDNTFNSKRNKIFPEQKDLHHKSYIISCHYMFCPNLSLYHKKNILKTSQSFP